MKTSRLAWALTLGLALALTAGAVSTVAPSGSAPAVTQETATGVLADAPATNFLDPYPGDMTTLPLERTDADAARGENVTTIALAARWGYLNDPAVAALEGRWMFNDTKTGGTFLGAWHLVNGRAHGSLEGRFTLPDDGHGRFRGTWDVADSRIGGFLWGEWVRGNRTNGHFDGKWNFTSGRDGGALAGGWALFRDNGGGFRGRAIAAPTMAPVDWDGSLGTTDGGVHLARTIRFERDDRVLPQTNRSLLEWTSTTTVNWDGILAVLRIADPNATVTLTTTQVSFTWTARELPGLHLIQAVDRAGHAIEVRVNAEDPLRNFLPSPGRIVGYREPAGPGVRVDSGVAVGSDVPSFYDPLLAKLIVHGVTRRVAIERLRRSVEGFELRGVQTNLPFHRALLSHPAFLSGDLWTTMVADLHLGERIRSRGPWEERIAAIASALSASGRLEMGASGAIETMRVSPWVRRGRRERAGGDRAAPARRRW